MRANIHQAVGENIFSTQEKQRRDYNRRHQVPNKIKVGQKAPLKNQRRIWTEKVLSFRLNGLAQSNSFDVK